MSICFRDISIKINYISIAEDDIIKHIANEKYGINLKKYLFFKRVFL